MSAFSVRSNIAEVRRALEKVSNTQVPFAMARALNDTAEDGLRAMQDEMRAVFDRPTRFALNAFMVWRATKATLTATIRERPSVGRRHFLKVQGVGGTRPQTALERLLGSRVATDVAIAAAVPASGARRDAHGNWSSGERNQALSGIKAQRDARSNTTARSAKRAPGRATFFVPKPGSRMSPGIYRRRGSELVKILHFTRSMPSYQRRIDWRETALKGVEGTYDAHFARRLAEAMATAR